MPGPITTLPSGDLPAAIRKCIILLGYILAVWQLPTSLLLIFTDHSSIFQQRQLHVEAYTLANHIFIILYLACPFLLLCGCWGFHHHRPWARLLLFIYSFLCIFANFGWQAVYFADLMHVTHGDHFYRTLILVIANSSEAFESSLFPLLLIFFLLRPELRDIFPQPAGGFSPIIQENTP